LYPFISIKTAIQKKIIKKLGLMIIVKVRIKSYLLWCIYKDSELFFCFFEIKSKTKFIDIFKICIYSDFFKNYCL